MIGESLLRLIVRISAMERESAVRHTLAYLKDAQDAVRLRAYLLHDGACRSDLMSAEAAASRFVDAVRRRHPQGPQMPNWRAAGFGDAPRAVCAPAGLMLYRVWGGSSRETGRWFSLRKPVSLEDGEAMLNIVAIQFLDSLPAPTGEFVSSLLSDVGTTADGFGPPDSHLQSSSVRMGSAEENLACWISTFEVAANTVIWIGPVRHGENDRAMAAEQVYIEFPHIGKVGPATARERLPSRHSVLGSAGRSRYRH